MTVWTPLYETHIQTTQTVSNESSSPIYPQWSITGPGFYPILKNVTTGETFKVNRYILAGETVTIDFSPTQRSISGSEQGDLSSYVTSDSVYWALAPGNSSVMVELGQTLPSSTITLLRIPR